MINISDNGKQINFILEQIQTNDSIESFSKTYHFKPGMEELKKHVDFKISGGTDIKARLEKMGLPVNKGDLVTIEIGVKEIQSKLIKEDAESDGE